METQFKLERPEEIIVNQDIKDPDVYLDQFINACARDSGEIATLKAIKSLSHDEKVKWLLSLKPNDRLEPLTTCILVLVTTTVIVVIGYEIVNGVERAITERQEVQQEVERCFERRAN